MERVVVTLGKLVSNSVNNCQSASRYVAVTIQFLKPVILSGGEPVDVSWLTRLHEPQSKDPAWTEEKFG
jgi:hypothetical protein